MDPEKGKYKLEELGKCCDRNIQKGYLLPCYTKRSLQTRNINIT
jgi:hypothetical protein